MRVIVFFIFLLTNLIVFSQDKSSFEKWEERILSNESYFKVVNSIENDTFKVYYKKGRIPKFLNDTLISWNSEVKFANPNQNYRSTDCGSANLPSRKIIFILKNDKHIFIIYWHGGRAKNIHILWAEFESNKMTDIWIGVTVSKIDSIDKLKEILKKNPEDLNTNFVCF